MLALYQKEFQMKQCPHQWCHAHAHEHIADALLIDKVVCRLNLHLFYLLVNPVTYVHLNSQLFME